MPLWFAFTASAPAESSVRNRPLSLRFSRMRNGLACGNLPEVGGGGGGGEHVSGVAGRAHSCISRVLVVVKTTHFTATRWAQKITAV